MLLADLEIHYSVQCNLSSTRNLSIVPKGNSEDSQFCWFIISHPHALFWSDDQTPNTSNSPQGGES